MNNPCPLTTVTRNAPPPTTAPQLPLRRGSDFSRAGGRWMVAGVAGAHLLGLWALLQVDGVRAAVREVAPMVVDLVAPERPDTPPPPPPPPAPPVHVQPLQQPPLLAAPTPAPVPAETFAAPAPPPEPAPAAPLAAPPAPPPPPAPVPAPAPPQRKLIPATAVRYTAEPPFEVPRASRRAGEHGTVVLRVVVSAQGLPLQISVQRSSGFPRLDEQALWAMRQARFQPYTEDGRALEVEALAPVEYPLQ